MLAPVNYCFYSLFTACKNVAPLNGSLFSLFVAEKQQQVINKYIDFNRIQSEMPLATDTQFDYPQYFKKTSLLANV